MSVVVKSKKPEPYIAALYRAIALRFYDRYAAARNSAAFYGEDIREAGHGSLPNESDAGEHYRRAVDDCIREEVHTAEGARATAELVGVIAVDQLSLAVAGEGTPISGEEDALHQAMLISQLSRWISNIAYAEAAERRRNEGDAP